MLPGLCSHNMKPSHSTEAVGEQDCKVSALLHRRNAETNLLTSVWWPISSFLTEREEKVAFANCPQNPRARRIFTFLAVGLLLIFQGSQSLCQSLTDTLCRFPLNTMCERLFNDSDQCLSGHLGVTAAHTLVGGTDDAGAHKKPFDSRESQIK